jgi:hypothetical protein
MVLLLAAVLLTAGLQASIATSPFFWEKDRGRRMAGNLLATLSLAIWFGILFAGRWIAYTQAG